MKFHNERSFCLCHASCSRAADALCDALVLPLEVPKSYPVSACPERRITEDKIGATNASNSTLSHGATMAILTEVNQRHLRGFVLEMNRLSGHGVCIAAHEAEAMVFVLGARSNCGTHRDHVGSRLLDHLVGEREHFAGVSIPA
jgi:hypothetical protein